MKFSPRFGPDQYYAFTSRVTARGLQRTTMLVIGCFTVSLALPAVLAMFNPKSTYLPGGKGILVGAVVACGTADRMRRKGAVWRERFVGRRRGTPSIGGAVWLRRCGLCGDRVGRRRQRLWRGRVQRHR